MSFGNLIAKLSSVFVSSKRDPVTGGITVSYAVAGRSSAQLGTTPTAADIALGDSTVFYDIADPTKRYAMNAGHTAFVALGGASGSSLTAAQKFGLKLRAMDRMGFAIHGDSMMTATSFPHTAAAKSKGQLRVEKRTNTAGYTSAQVNTALQASGVDSRSDVILWMEGANDAAGAVTNASHISTFTTIGDYIAAGGKIPFLAVSPPSNVSTTIQGRLEAYAIREILLAEKKGWVCVNPWEMHTITGGAWTSGASDDGIHPTNKVQGSAGEYMWDCVINNRPAKLLPRTNTGAGLSQSNVLNITNTSGLPAGWTALSFASASYSLADYAAPFLGKKCSAVVSRSDGNAGYLTKEITTGSIDGHVLRMTGVISLGASTNMRVYLNMVFYNGVTQLASKTVAVLTTADGVDNYVTCEGEVPAGTTKVQAQFVCGPNETTGTEWSGTFGFGQIDAYDVTALTA